MLRFPIAIIDPALGLVLHIVLPLGIHPFSLSISPLYRLLFPTLPCFLSPPLSRSLCLFPSRFPASKIPSPTAQSKRIFLRIEGKKEAWRGCELRRSGEKL